MAAYAALLSLMHTIDDLHRHPRPPISLPQKQVASLAAKVGFLQEFLEGYNPHLTYTTEADPLEIRIFDAAYAAEEAIETQIMDTITKETSSDDALYPALQKVIQEMVEIEKVAMEIKETTGIKYKRRRKSTPPPSSSSIPQKKILMVGADDVLLEMKSKLTSDARALQIVPIVGMGGSGKTTLASSIYQDGLIKVHFDICAWATVSQEDNIIDVLRQLIKEFNEDWNEGVLGEMLHKHLYRRRYLIIMDDMWSIDAWDRVRNFFPNNNNGSRIIITTRLLNLSSKLSTSNGLEMSLLDDAHSWILLSEIVFGEKGCPSGLEDIGKKIGKSCKGLRLSIVAIGGFLAKSEQTREFWEYIEENLNSIVNSGDNEHCLKILYMSYKQLPVHLKPCFLYMGVFREDEAIRVSKLIRFWVAEGFLKAVSGKSLEEIGKEYIKDLIDRNLILIHEVGSIGSIKECKVHDLLRDLCLREAQKERFYVVLTKPHSLRDVQRRIVIPKTISKNQVVKVLSSMSHTRSLIWDHEYAAPPLNFKLLRILHEYETSGEFFKIGHTKMVNARLLSVTTMFPSMVSLVWNLQTLIVSDNSITLPTDIWYMSHIRHVQSIHGIHLPDPPNGQDDIVLGNLQTMGEVRDFKFNEQLAKKIPNIKKLKMAFYEDGEGCCLKDLDCLDKLESLTCKIHRQDFLPRLISFPHSLKKLTLLINESPCTAEILEKIGVLPHLEKLRLFGAAFKEREWKTTEGRFRSLKYLRLGSCKGLEVWTSESSHFPCLEHLHLHCVSSVEIPLEFAEVSTLRVIELTLCETYVVISAKRVVEEQLYGEGEAALQVRVLHWEKEEAHDSLASPNFRFTYFTTKKPKAAALPAEYSATNL